MDRKEKELYDELLSESRMVHAKVVYRKCIRAGKLRWASEIGLKYGLLKDDDTVVALGMAFLVGAGVWKDYNLPMPFNDYLDV